MTQLAKQPTFSEQRALLPEMPHDLFLELKREGRHALARTKADMNAFLDRWDEQVLRFKLTADQKMQIQRLISDLNRESSY